MSELQFPKNPITGQEYDFPPYKYYWDGEKWKTKGVGYNPVNDLRDELEPRISDSESKISNNKLQISNNESRISNNESKVFESLRRSYAEAGLNLVDGSFEEGGTLTSATDVLLYKVSGVAYSWGGTLPITVAPNSTPTPLGADGWIDQSYATLRSNVTALGFELNSITQSIIAIQKLATSLEASPYRNKIVDGRFDFWHEGTSQTSSGYGSDTMWANYDVGSTKIHQRLELTPGVDLPCVENPSARYASRTIVSSVTGAENYVRKVHRIEGVRTLAGKKATLSFYARANADRNLGIHIEQSFGTGGSPSPLWAIVSTKLAITGFWVRYSLTFTVRSIFGKTLGTDNNDALNIFFGFDQGSGFGILMDGLGHQSGTFDIACVQLEEGEQATKFEELPMSVAENLVGRYYETNYPYGSPVGTPNAPGGYRSFTHPKATGNAAGAATQFRVTKREIPVVSIYSSVTGAKDRVFANGTAVDVFTVDGLGKTGFASLGITIPIADIDISFYYVADARL